MNAEAAADFPFLLPPAYLRKIQNSSAPDALIRQVLPHADELLDVAAYGHDPLDEKPLENEGLIEKYAGRLLVMVTQSCSGHCRFCFRRHLLDSPLKQEDIQVSFRQRMQQKEDISEVILSGGDPLVLSDRRLRDWFELIGQYPQVRRIRIHTREPVFSPQRITPERITLFRAAPVPLVMAVHVNHPDELDQLSQDRLLQLQKAGVLLLTQTVLLKGVNDSAETLAQLLERAVACGMAPYYLHQLDRVAGAAHFAVDRIKGLQIIRQLRERLPGYMVPRYVEEIPGKTGKTPIE
ncbi:MAG: KamA family radical SAM protein [Xanthomonadales bacterium]|nr:KamA family radical SAM protein [Xanthomonadales bacterium]